MMSDAKTAADHAAEVSVRRDMAKALAAPDLEEELNELWFDALEIHDSIRWKRMKKIEMDWWGARVLQTKVRGLLAKIDRIEMRLLRAEGKEPVGPDDILPVG